MKKSIGFLPKDLSILSLLYKIEAVFSHITIPVANLPFQHSTPLIVPSNNIQTAYTARTVVKADILSDSGGLT